MSEALLNIFRRTMWGDSSDRDVYPMNSCVPDVEENAVNPFIEVRLLRGHNDMTRTLTQLVREDSFMSTSDDGNAMIWDKGTGVLLNTLVGHKLPITCALIRDDNIDAAAAADNDVDRTTQLIVTTAADKTLRIWNSTTGECIRIAYSEGVIRCLVSKKTGYFISGGPTVCLWSWEGDILAKFTAELEDSNYRTMTYLPNRNLIITAPDSPVLSVFTFSIGNNGSPSSKGLLSHRDDSTIIDTSAATVACMGNLKSHRENVRVIIRLNCASFCSASLDGAIVIWSSDSLTPLMVLNHHEEYKDARRVYMYAVQNLITGARSNELFSAIGKGFALFDVISGACLLKCPVAHRSNVLGLTLLYNGSILVTCSADATVRLWDVREDQYSRISNTDLNSVPIAPQPVCLGELIGHSGAVFQLLALNQHCFASCGADGTIFLWRDKTEINNQFKGKSRSSTSTVAVKVSDHSNFNDNID